MEYIRQQYHEIRLFYRQNIKRMFLSMIVLFSFCLIVFSIVLSINPGLATRMLIKTSSFVENTINLSGILPMIVKNLFAGLYLIVLGCVPFLFIPSWFVVMNGSMIGILLGSTTISNITLGAIFASIVPHGFILIPAMLLAGAYGVYLCRAMIAHVLHKDSKLSFKILLYELSRAYFFIIVPMMVIASLLQALITPLIVSLM